MAIAPKSPVFTEIQFDHVSYMRGENLLFQDLSFKLVSGQILWIQGDNGIGKTSILRLAAGLTNPYSGEIRYSLNDETSSPENMLAFQSHYDALEPSFTVCEELDFWADIYDSQINPNACLEQVGLTNRLSVKTKDLSAGQKRRLALARLLISERPVWLMDEPKAAMDKEGQNLIDELMQTHVDNGGAILAATHNQARLLGKKSRRLLLEAES
jgi:heme exporter protein A